MILDYIQIYASFCPNNVSILFEAYGTGILKTIESYERFGLKPIIEISSNAFKITLPNATISSRKNNDVTSLNEKEKVTISMFDKTETISRTDVEKELSISQTMAVKLLKQLLDKSIINRFGQGKNVRYIKKTL